jgi:hypothetical protein
MLWMLPLNYDRERRGLRHVLRILIQCTVLADVKVFKVRHGSVRHE